MIMSYGITIIILIKTIYFKAATLHNELQARLKCSILNVAEALRIVTELGLERVMVNQALHGIESARGSHQ